MVTKNRGELNIKKKKKRRTEESSFAKIVKVLKLEVFGI